MELYRQGEHSTAELADLFGLVRSTVYRALERDRARGTQDRPLRATAPRRAPRAHRAREGSLTDILAVARRRCQGARTSGPAVASGASTARSALRICRAKAS